MAELASQPTSIQSLYSWFRDDKLIVNRRYQRKLVWTQLEKQKLIESLLRKYPVPAILLAERDGAPGTYEIIDGLQRLHAIVSFIEQSFPTSEGDYFNLTYFPTAKGLADEGVFSEVKSERLLAQRAVSTLLDYNLALSVMRGATENEINDVFDRINTYGHRLSDQERRQAGVQNSFSSLVREAACIFRGDVSEEVLSLKLMPSISIDLPMGKHGYEVRADEVFWVNQGILRSTDLRDSMDEQCIADIAACIVTGTLIERSKNSLDELYNRDGIMSERVLSALEVYGADRFLSELKFCVDEMLKVCYVPTPSKLRDIVFKKKTTNPFPSVFAILLFSFHKLLVVENKRIADYTNLRKDLTGLSARIESGQSAASPDQREKNVNSVTGLIGSSFIPSTEPTAAYGNNSSTDIEAAIRRSEIELAHYELKQGMLSLHSKRAIDPQSLAKILNTICAIANNGPSRQGMILIGVCDKPADAARIVKLDAVDPRKVGRRSVVGIVREAKYLQESTEAYFTRWKNLIKDSKLSDALRMSVLSSLDYNSFYGLGIITIHIPPQEELSYIDGQVYWRNSDSTERATDAKQIATLARRF